MYIYIYIYTPHNWGRQFLVAFLGVAKESIVVYPHRKLRMTSMMSVVMLTFPAIPFDP